MGVLCCYFRPLLPILEKTSDKDPVPLQSPPPSWETVTWQPSPPPPPGRPSPANGGDCKGGGGGGGVALWRMCFTLLPKALLTMFFLSAPAI